MSNKQDIAKFRHLSRHLWLTRHLSLITSIDENGKVVMHIDRAYVAYSDGRSYLGLSLTMEQGAMINVSKKLELSTISSTETEIVSDGEHSDALE